MKRPMVLAATCYAAGLIVAEYFHPPLRFLFPVTFLVLIGTAGLSRIRPILIWLLVMLTGCTNLAVRTAVISPFDLRVLQGDSVELVSVRGLLTKTPEERMF